MKGNDRRYKQNNGTSGPSCRRGAGGLARGGESGFVPRQGDLPRPEQHPDIRSREDEAPIAEQIEEIATLPFHRVQHLVKACGLPQHVGLQERAIELALARLLEGRTPKPGQILAVQRIVYGLGDNNFDRRDGIWEEYRPSCPLFSGPVHHNPSYPSRQARGKSVRSG
jgi:hypothetical protein